MNEPDRDTTSVAGRSPHAFTDLVANGETFRAIVMLLSEGVVVQDAAASIIASNPSAERILGLSHDQMMGRTSVDPRWWAIHSDGSPFPGETHPAMVTLRTGQPHVGVIMGVHKPDGTLTWIRVDSYPLFQPESPVPTGVVALFKEITDEVQAKRESHLKDKRYRTFLTLSPDGISVVDGTGRILTCNEQFAHMHGYEHSRDLVGKHASEFTSPAAYARLFQEVAAAFESGRSVARGIEVEVLQRDGTTITTEYSVTQAPWPEAPGGVAFISNVRDITRRKQLVAELECHRTHLEELMQERTRDLQAEIAERTAAQAALQRSQASLAAAERLAHLGSWEFDLAADELRLSDEMKRIFGFDLIARPPTWADILNAVHPDDRGAVQAALARAMQPDQTYRTQYRIVLPGGETRVVYAQGEVLRDAAGQPVRVHGMVQDITERERVREALDQRVGELASLQALGYEVSLSFAREDLIQIVLEKIITVAGLDMARLFLLRNGNLHLVGVRARGAALSTPTVTCALGECLCGLAARDGQLMVTGDARSDARCTRENCKAYGLSSLAALPLRSRDTVIGVLALGSSAQDAFAGRLTFLEAAADQIAIGLQNALLHQEIQARAAGLEEAVAGRTRELQTERDRTRAILETMSESVVVTDLDGQVLFINPSTQALTGFSRDELLRQPLWGAWSVPTLSATLSEVQKALGDGRAWRGEITGCRKDGTLYTAEVTGTPLYDPSADSVPVGGVWVQRDITALKEAERLKDQFVSNVSHELRTPVSVISLSCDNLEAFYSRLEESQRRQMLHDIHEQSHLLVHLVEDILTLSQIDSGRIPQTRRLVDLAGLVREETERQWLISEGRSQRLVVTADERVLVLGNSVQLRQVVRNLLDNAIKYTPAGGRISCACEIRFPERAAARGKDASSMGPWATIEITDDGIGIPTEAMPFLFERFFRVNGEGGAPGTGLGLSIARELVRLHEGWVDVVSTPGKGSTFTVYLPLAKQGTGDVIREA